MVFRCDGSRVENETTLPGPSCTTRTVCPWAASEPSDRVLTLGLSKFIGFWPARRLLPAGSQDEAVPLARLVRDFPALEFHHKHMRKRHSLARGRDSRQQVVPLWV